jgi:hypothetical protein
MKLTKVHLFIILALALILCPILGVCSNSSVNAYNYSEGFDTNSGSGTGVLSGPKRAQRIQEQTSNN